MIFEEESNVADYLAELLDQDTDNDIITLRQSGLARRIIDTLHLDNNTSPFETSVDFYLHLENGEPLQSLYIYVSAISMLGYPQGCFCANIICVIILAI